MKYNILVVLIHILILNYHGLSPWLEYEEPPLPGNMRINVRAFWNNKETNEITSALLLPTKDNIDSNTSIDFNIPIYDTTTNINFFGCQFNANNGNSNNNGWKLWNGYARNILIFNKFLNKNQLLNLFKARYISIL